MSEGIEIFGWTIHFYGIIIMGGVVLASFLAARRARERGHDPEIVWDLLIWLIIGGVIGGAIALYFFARKHKLSFAEWVDIAAPSLALGQAVGRWGNFVNQELYGAPTDLPWAISIEPHKRVSGFADFATYHPLFLYESLWNLANMAILLWISRRFGEQLKPGDVFLTYLVIYPVGRFLLDFLRLDASMLGGINANQSFMAVVAVLAAAAMVWRHRR